MAPAQMRTCDNRRKGAAGGDGEGLVRGRLPMWLEGARSSNKRCQGIEQLPPRVRRSHRAGQLRGEEEVVAVAEAGARLLPEFPGTQPRFQGGDGRVHDLGQQLRVRLPPYARVPMLWAKRAAIVVPSRRRACPQARGVWGKSMAAPGNIGKSQTLLSLPGPAQRVEHFGPPGRVVVQRDLDDGAAFPPAASGFPRVSFQAASVVKSVSPNLAAQGVSRLGAAEARLSQPGRLCRGSVPLAS